MNEPLLVVDGLDKRFGGVRALQGLSFSVNAGEVVGLIGPNGSGKSTSVNTISGMFPPSGGEIRLCGKSVTELPINRRVALGLARTFQTTNLFEEYTVFEQVMAACHPRYNVGGLAAVLRLSGSRREEEKQREKVQEILSFVGLSDASSNLTSSLSSAEQRLLMIATALASEPKVLLLDEPAAGMVAHERKSLAALIMGLRDRGVSAVVIEHHMSLIMEVCDRIVVLNFGEKIAEGVPEEIRNNQAVVDAYLGEGH